jgi:hypothetical protein
MRTLIGVVIVALALSGCSSAGFIVGDMIDKHQRSVKEERQRVIEVDNGSARPEYVDPLSPSPK